MIAIDLSGKTALVTGATGQLGRVMVRTIASAGADVIIHYRSNKSQADMLVREIRQTGREALAVQGDVTDEGSVKKMRSRITAKLRMPDIVVCNAVIRYDWKNVLTQSLNDYESQFLSCTMHVVLMAQVFVPNMIKNKWGRIIGINTECVMDCSPTQSAYVSGKRGMDGVLRVLAREVGEHGITVNQVAPGWTVSENCPDSAATKSYREHVPLKRRGTDREIANAVAFLASDLAGFITGVYLPVCGGKIMPGI
jgi:3-oxoacyl-[acyl-carrier protein] reductase